MMMYPTTMSRLFGLWPCAAASKLTGSPKVRTMTPIIWTSVATRNSASSLSYADANHVKFIHAHVMAKMAKPYAPIAEPT